MKHAQLAGGVLAGLFAGTILGVLFAPAKGSETRKKISGKKTNKAFSFSPVTGNDIIPGYEHKKFVDESF